MLRDFLLLFFLSCFSSGAKLPMMASFQNAMGKLVFYAQLQDNYPFINYEQNKIGNANRLENFFAALERVEKRESRRIHIVHIGDSHIQADFFSGELRRRLQQRFGNAGRGLVFPYQLANTNCPTDLYSSSNTTWNYKRCVFFQDPLPIGISGISIATQRPDFNLSLEVKNNQGLDYSFDRVTLFNLKGQDYVDFKVSAGDNPDITPLVLDNSNPQEGYYSTFYFSSPVQQLNLQGVQTKAEQNKAVINGILLENSNEVGVVYSMIGVNGAMFMHYNLASPFFAQLAAMQPDLVIVSLGTNESLSKGFDSAWFKGEGDKFINSIKAAVPESSILTTINPDVAPSSKGYGSYSTAAREVLFEIVGLNETGYWDLQTVMGGTGSMNLWLANGLAYRDKIHFSQTGYELQGRLLFEALMTAYAGRNK